MTGDASRFFSVRMSIVLTLFAAVLLSGMMVPSIAFGEETGVGHEAGAVDGGTQASTEAHGAADQDEDDSGSGNPHDPDAPSDEGAGSGGVSPSPAYVPGWNTVDGNRYFADEQGKLKSGWLIDGGKRYYLDPGNGNAMARGFVAIEGKSYYLDTDGVLFSSGWLLVDRAWYYAAASGEIETGWLKLGGTWYYLDPSRGGAMLTGSYRVGSTLYHARPSGALVTGNGWVRTDGAWYYASPSGALRTGWLKLSGTWYWLDPETGVMATGWYKDGSTWYYSDGSGAMLADRWLNLGGTWYALSASGAMRTGWYQEGSARYWLDPETGAMAVGRCTIDGREYVFSGSGAMVNNVWVSLGNGSCGFIDGSGDAVLVASYDAQGRIVCADGKTGWRTAAGKTFYFDPKDEGALRTGMFDVDGVRYYADASGIRQTGWVKVSGTWYYLDPSSGVMRTGWVSVGGSWYYLDPSTGAMQTGWLQESGDWYYLKSSGAMVSNASVKVSDGTYWYMNGSGRHDKQAGIDIIMRTARSLLGVPYVWLGVYPQDGGMDCASFTWYLYKQLGIDIGFETYDQMYSGVRVFGDPQPGDIILMYYGAWPNYNPMLPEHVVLYAGGGMIYEEPTFGGRCQYVSLASKGASTTTAQRILS